MAGPNDGQIEYWNGRAGEKWAALQSKLDAMLGAVTAELRHSAGDVAGQRVLDVGCGTGETCTIWLANGADVTGVDVSAPMLAVAAARTGQRAKLVHADAATWQGERQYDLVVSRFGVMFFADPDAAFARIASNLRPGGRLLFACWRPVDENEWVTAPAAAIRDLLPEPPPAVPHAPGPFGLADNVRLYGILSRAGFVGIEIRPVDFEVVLASEGGAAEAVGFAMQIGPAAAPLAEAPPEARALAAARLEALLSRRERAGRVALGAATWIVEARRPG